VTVVSTGTVHALVLPEGGSDRHIVPKDCLASVAHHDPDLLAMAALAPLHVLLIGAAIVLTVLVIAYIVGG
jgi:hypothetical protein